MLKIAALNEDSSSEEDDNEGEEEVTREALEEIAMQQYGKTLELQKKGRQQDALNLLKDLLDTELLYDVKKVEGQESTTSPLLKLKYLCYKNIASISAQLGDKENAVEAYLEASHLDNTDITLWYRLGKISLELRKYDLALFAFERGIECNPKHWPCLDHLVTLLLGLGQYNECITTIYNALQLDEDYLRGRAYRKYIFTDYPHVQQYMAMLNPLYKWTPNMDEEIQGDECQKLIKEATDINEIFIQQVMETNVCKRLPILTLNKPIENLTWLSVGESIVDLHMHISEKLLSHACIVKVELPEEKLLMNNETVDEAMDVDVSITKQGSADQPENKQNGDTKNGDNGNESDKMDVEQDVNQALPEGSKVVNESKDSKKSSRRRGSSVRFLQQWEWCNKRKSSRKKPNKMEQETLYDILKRLLPKHLRGEDNGQEQINKPGKEFKGDDSMDTMDLYKLFEEKERNAAESNSQGENKEEIDTLYFNTEKEQTDVQAFIQKYVDSTCDIITMVDDFVLTLSKFWDIMWPEGLADVYMEANWCSRQHSDPPLGYLKEENVLKNFIKINILHLEVCINKLLQEDDGKKNVEMDLVDLLRMLCSRSEEGDEAVTLTLRFLWVKCHILLYKDQVEFALDCLYYIIDKLYGLEDEGNSFTLKVVNFTKCSIISKNNCLELIKTLERNKQLSTVPGLFERGKYEEVISILQDSFKHCQSLASKQDWKGMSLDWAIQLMTVMESLWAINDTEQCFIWATICLRESLKQYTLCEQASDDLEKWSLVVIKTLISIEHILNSEGSAYLDVLPEKNTIHMIQDVIQIIIHQLDESNTSPEMPLNTVVCWIILHHVFQREEDCGRMPKKDIVTETNDTELPVSFMVLFMAHEQLGRKGWCANNDSKLLFFILKTVISRLRSPALSGVVEIVSQYLEQCVLCLFGHPKKIKQRYLVDHAVTPGKLDWDWSQLIFDLYRPEELPEWNFHRMSSISGETEQLFQNMLSLAPPGMDPHPHYSDVISFIERRKSKLHHFNVELPYRMRDIYYLLADYYFKNNETVKAMKYYIYDIVICRKRFDSWAGMALARGSLLETKLNSCESFRNEMEYLNRATAVEFCYKQALEIDTSHSMLWIEYGNFVYGVHSFCSRMLKQASESLSMENFEVLENRKESMLDTASKCFVKALKQWMEESEGDDKGPQDERWLHYYMLGKISEKKNEQPQRYLDYYQKAATFLQENNATYPSKINYSNPQNLSVEALEIQYRIHASILKYIEQHENKVICAKDGKCFKACLDKCASGPFSRKKVVKETPESKEQNDNEKMNDTNGADGNANQDATAKRPSSEMIDEVEGNESKKVKIDEEKPKENTDVDKDNKTDTVVPDKPESVTDVQADQEPAQPVTETANAKVDDVKVPDVINDTDVPMPNTEASSEVRKDAVKENVEESDAVKKADVVATETDQTKVVKESENTSNTGTSKDNSSSESSSDSSSSDSTSSSSSSSSSDSNGKQRAPTEMTPEEISEVISTCLNSLEDCVSRFPLHYKALYRLTHFHFYYKKEKNIQRCKDLMLGNFVTNTGAKLQGLFCERKNSNFFNSIWRIPSNDVDRPGSFATHMSRCILITMEILKELDDHHTLLDLTLHLQKSPEADKKYLRESERIELSQQALSLCTRSIKGQMNKFNKVDDLSSTTPEKQQVLSFMLDLYAIYQKIPKNLPTNLNKIFSGLLVDCYKIYSGKLDSENLLHKCLKKCHSIIAAKKQQAQQAAQPSPPPPVSKVETPATTTAPPVALQPVSTQSVVPPPPPPPKKSKPSVSIIPATSFLPHVDTPMPYPKVPSPYLPYMPMMDRNLLSALSGYDQTTAALYLSSMGTYSGMSSAYQQDLFRQIISSTLDSTYMQTAAKPKYNQSSSNSKPKTSTAPTSKSVPNVSKPSTSQTQTSKQSASSNTKSSSSYVSSSQKSHSKDAIKSGHIPTSQSGTIQSSHANSSSNVQQSHQSSTNANSNVKSAYQSSVNSGTNIKPTQQSSTDRSNNHKSAHQSTSSTNSKGHQSSTNTGSGAKPAHQSSSSPSISVKSTHHSSSSTGNNVKLAHQSSSSPGISVKSAHELSSSIGDNVKPAHQSSSSPGISVKSAHQLSSSIGDNVKPAHQSSSSPGISVKSAHQLSSSIGDNVKPAHQSSSGTSSSVKPAHQSSSGTSSSVKPAHQSSSGTSSSVKPAYQSSSGTSSSVKPAHQSSSGTSSSVKPAHQSSSGTSSSVKPAHRSSTSTSSVKPAHQSSSSSSNNVKPAHQSSSANSNSKAQQSSTSRGSSVNPAHQSSTNTSNSVKNTHQAFPSSNTNVLSTSPGPPHPQISPGKTLQEKLAERQKQNPNTSTSSSDHLSGRAMQAAALAKLPSSLSVTKTGSSSKSSSSSHSAQRTSDTNTSRNISKDNRNVSQQSGNHVEKLAQARKVMDSSEIIVLDDDD